MTPQQLPPLLHLPKSERSRLYELTEPERRVAQLGYQGIAGVDEAGRGPLAGPVVAAACILHKPLFFPGVNDSKLVSPKRRRALFDTFKTHADLEFGVGIVNSAVIDQINIYQASLQAMRNAVGNLSSKPDYLLVDGMELKMEAITSEKLIKGDRRSQLIAIASIIAKETRDELMRDYDICYPGYGFAQHKGYGTTLHREALQRLGPCPIHRLTFSFK